MPSTPPISPLPATDPISPVSRNGTSFPHKTSPAVVTQTPLIDTSTPAINDAPVELDGGAITPEELRRRRTEEEFSGVRGSMRGPDEGDIDAEFLGQGGNPGREAREVGYSYFLRRDMVTWVCV